MVRIVVCDDSETDIDLISSQIKLYGAERGVDITLVTFSDPGRLSFDLDSYGADIYILDVEMPKTNGFELADEIRARSDDAVIIFLSSHEDLAPRGYRSKALRYVIKLNIGRDLSEALDCALDELSKTDRRSITLRSEGEMIRLPHKRIVYVRRESRRLVVYADPDIKITDTRGIKELYDCLDDGRFLFIDRSCFVNADKVTKISGCLVTMINGDVLTVSRRSLQKLKQTMLDWM